MHESPWEKGIEQILWADCKQVEMGKGGSGGEEGKAEEAQTPRSLRRKGFPWVDVLHL